MQRFLQIKTFKNIQKDLSIVQICWLQHFFHVNNRFSKNSRFFKISANLTEKLFLEVHNDKSTVIQVLESNWF